MSEHNLLQRCKYVKGLDPVADYTAGDPVYTDIIKMGNWETATFFVYKGVGTTGTATITLQACDDNEASNTSNVGFRYSSNTATDVIGDLTTVTSAGVLISAGSSQIWAATVDASELTNSYKFVRLALNETDSTAVLGGVMCILTGGSDQGDDLATVIA